MAIYIPRSFILAVMDAYALLRQQAAEKRDNIIRAAQNEYLRELREIEAMRHRLAGKPLAHDIAGSNESIIQMIRDLMPKDRAFTIVEVTDLLRSANPGRVFRPVTVRFFFPQMAEIGLIKKVGCDSKGQTLWVAAELSVAETSNGAPKLIEMAVEVLRELGPMMPIDLIVRMQERGYRPKSNPRRLVGWLRRAAKICGGRLIQDGDGRWRALSVDINQRGT